MCNWLNLVVECSFLSGFNLLFDLCNELSVVVSWIVLVVDRFLGLLLNSNWFKILFCGKVGVEVKVICGCCFVFVMFSMMVILLVVVVVWMLMLGLSSVLLWKCIDFLLMLNCLFEKE